MKIALIGAMEEELNSLAKSLDNSEKVIDNKLEYVKGTYLGHEIFLMECGIGKVNAAIKTTRLLDKERADLVINTGTAGAISPSLQIGEMVIGDSLVYHDVDLTGFGYELGQMAGMDKEFKTDQILINLAQNACKDVQINYQVGQIVSGDQFISGDTAKKEIAQNFPQALVCEMESTAIAHVCYDFEVPLVVFRIVSDKAEGQAEITHEQLVEKVSETSANIVRSFIRLL